MTEWMDESHQVFSYQTFKQLPATDHLSSSWPHSYAKLVFDIDAIADI